MPLPGRLKDDTNIVKGGPPAEPVPGQGRTPHQDGRIAGPPGFLAYGDGASGHPFGRPDDLAHRVAVSVPQIEGARLPSPCQVLEGQMMGLRRSLTWI